MALPPIDHSKREHALLSASSSHRWLSCTPSARLEEEYVKEHGSQTTSYAEEGTTAHELAQLRLNFLTYRIPYKEYESSLEKIQQSGYYSTEMFGYVETYVQQVLEHLSKATAKDKAATLNIESRVDFSDIIPDGFGSADAIILSEGAIEVFDLKYGKGVLVEAQDNPQLMLYAIGAIRENDMLYDIHEVSLTIIQPRVGGFSTASYSRSELEAWANDYVKPRAALAFKGEGEQVPGEHCKFCKVKAQCRALASMAMERAKEDFKNDTSLLCSVEEITEMYKSVPVIKDWCESVSAFLLDKAMSGVEVPGYKVVEGVSRRVFTSEDKVIEKLQEEGYDFDDITKTSLKGIGEIEKLVGKKKFEPLLGSFVDKPQGKPTLVPLSDKRPPLNSPDQAAIDFLS